MSKLSEYIEISAFNENTALVQKDTAIYVKKRVPKELAYIYKILLNNWHKNISDIIEVFEYEDCAIIIEEYINGETLQEILAEQKTLDEAETKNIIGQVCDGLIFLHNHNIIHRDINPNNIMITKDNAVKIIDFDISRSVKKGAKSDTVVLGTVGYAAPEQFGFSQSGTRTDLYAVGVLANVMLTGEMPNVSLYRGKLGRIIKKATYVDASVRYRSIVEFKHAFTNEVDENTSAPVKILRHIPGFRTWTVWKMLIALIFYAVYVPIMAVFLRWSLVSFKYFLLMVTGETFAFAIPFVMLTNSGGIWRRISTRPFKAITGAVILACLSFIFGSCIILIVLGEIL